MPLPAKYVNHPSNFPAIILASAQKLTGLIQTENAFHVKQDVKPAHHQLLAANVSPHLFFNKTIALADAVKDTSYQDQLVLAALKTVSDVPPLTNASIVKMASSCTEVPATLFVHQELLLTTKPINAYPATAHAEPAPITPAHAQAANQERDIYKLPEPTKDVLKNALKEPSPKTTSVKSAISDALNVSVLLTTVLPVLPEDSCTMVLVGITVLVS